MSKPSDTPITDAAAFEVHSAGDVVREVVLADRARKLERDRAVLLEALRDVLPHAERGVEALDKLMVGDLYPRINLATIERARAAIKQAEGDK